MAAIGDNPVFILQEIVAKTIKDVVDEDARFDFSSKQLSLIEYGEKWIKLPEKPDCSGSNMRPWITCSFRSAKS